MSNRAMEHDTRLTNLEIKVSFTEDMVEALNKTVFRQQEQIDMLIQEIVRLRQQPSDAVGAGSHRPTDDLPPHY